MANSIEYKKKFRMEHVKINKLTLSPILTIAFIVDKSLYLVLRNKHYVFVRRTKDHCKYLTLPEQINELIKLLLDIGPWTLLTNETVIISIFNIKSFRAATLLLPFWLDAFYLP